MRSVGRVTVPMAIDESWRRYTDLEFAFKVNKKLKSTRLISGPRELGLGRVTEMHFEFSGKPHIILQEITAFEPPRKMVATSKSPLMVGLSEVSFESVGDSSTLITF